MDQDARWSDDETFHSDRDLDFTDYPPKFRSHFHFSPDIPEDRLGTLPHKEKTILHKVMIDRVECLSGLRLDEFIDCA